MNSNRAALWSLLLAASGCFGAAGAMAQAKKAAPAPTKSFTVDFNEGAVNGSPVSLIATLRETRQGASVKQTEIEMCFATSTLSRRMDRFTAVLTQREGAWNGAAVTLNRSGSRDALNFAGEIRVKDNVIKFEQKDASFFEEDSPPDNNPVFEVQPSTSREVPLNTVSIIARPAAISALTPLLRKHQVEIRSDSLIADCDALRTNTHSMVVEVDPARARALVSEAQATAGVIKAGWTGGATVIGDAIRIPANRYFANGVIDRDRLYTEISAAVSKAINQSAAKQPEFSSSTGVDTIYFAGPSISMPNAGLLDTTEVNMVIAPEGLQSSTHLVIYLDELVRSMEDPGSDAGIRIQDPKQGEGEGVDPDSGVRKLIQAAIARGLNGEVWSDDKQAWVKL